MTWKCTNTPKGENKLYSDAKGVVPSLDLRFAEGKNLNDYMTATPLVDHQRSMSGSNLSPGTFVNSSGLIETAKVNLIVYSEDFSVSSAWVAAGATPVQSTTVLAPNNLSFTYKLEENNTTGAHRFLSGSSNNIPAVLGNSYTFSFYAKNAGRDYAYIRLNTSSGDICAGSIRLSDATVTETSSGTITATSVGNGWVRIVGTGTSPATSNAFPEIRASNSAIYSNYTGDGTSGIYVWGAQLEEGTTATTYIPTTTSASAAPRFDHDPTTGESLGLLIEESRTNKLINSSDFSSGYGVNATAALDLNSSTAPDGTQTAALLRPTVDTTNASIFRDAGDASGDFVVSMFAKSSGKSWISIRNAQGNSLVWFNLTTGQVGTVEQNFAPYFVSGSIEPFGNGWYRCSVKATVTYNYFLVAVVDADNSTNVTVNGNDGIYIWGAQLEAGSFPTSYIPTTGTALTRSADVASITGSNFSSWYNQSEGTVFGNYSSFSYGNATALPTTAHFTDGTLNNYIRINSGATYVVRNFTNAGNVNQSNVAIGGVPASGVSYSFAVGIALNDMAVHTNGLSSFDTTYLVPVVNKIEIGNWFAQSNTWLNGHIARLTYFPDRLPDSSLQTMTTP